MNTEYTIAGPETVCRSVPRRTRAAFLLLTVLVAIVISGLLLAATARHSYQLATQAIERGRELQLQWGARSCRQAVLAAASEVFGDDNEQPPAQSTEAQDASRPNRLATSVVEQSVLLGAIPFQLTLCDEDAKVNLNAVFHYSGKSAVGKYLGGTWRGVPVRLLPEVESQQLIQTKPEEREDDEGPPPAFRSWGQVFDLSTVGDSRVLLPRLTRETTCWGSGRLNVVRASDQSIREVGRLVVSRGQIGQFLKELRKFPERPIERLFDQLRIDQEDRFLLQELLGEQSSSYGLWITAGSGPPAWQQFSVNERMEVVDRAGNRSNQIRTQSFVF